MNYQRDVLVPDVQYEMHGTLAITNAHAGAESPWNNGNNPDFRGILRFPADQNRCYGGYSQAAMEAIGYQGKPIVRITLASAQYDGTTVCDIPLPPPPPAGWQPPSDGGTTWFDPLVLDLTGDGIRTTGLDRPVSFDIDGNGRREWITWTDPASFDAFLWIDLFGKNRVDSGSELFGVGTALPDGSKATDGFQALSIYDAPARRKRRWPHRCP